MDKILFAKHFAFRNWSKWHSYPPHSTLFWEILTKGLLMPSATGVTNQSSYFFKWSDQRAICMGLKMFNFSTSTWDWQYWHWYGFAPVLCILAVWYFKPVDDVNDWLRTVLKFLSSMSYCNDENLKWHLTCTAFLQYQFIFSAPYYDYWTLCYHDMIYQHEYVVVHYIALTVYIHNYMKQRIKQILLYCLKYYFQLTLWKVLLH